MKVSAQQAIKNFCKGCIYDPHEKGNWLEQVENCTVVKCELYDHRPLTKKTRSKNYEDYLATLPVVERDIILEKQRLSGLKLLESRNKKLE